MNKTLFERPGEESSRKPETLLPGLSYKKALSSHFTLDQVTYTVSNCPNYVFKRLISECGQASSGNRNWRPMQLENLLHMIDTDCSDVARWYALNVLLDHKIALPLEIT